VADAAGVLYVTDPAQATVWRVEAGVALPLHRDDRYRTLGGIAVGSAGELVFVAGDVFALPVDQLGRAGERRVLLDLHDHDGAYGVAVARDGSIFVSLATADRLLVLDRSGSERDRVVSPSFDRPAGLAVGADGVLVANRAGPDRRDNWALLRVRP
jgi:sugar lactone lactonase YvrE